MEIAEDDQVELLAATDDIEKPMKTLLFEAFRAFCLLKSGSERCFRKESAQELAVRPPRVGRNVSGSLRGSTYMA